MLMVDIQKHAWVLNHALGFVDVWGFILGLFWLFHQVSFNLVEAVLLQGFLCTRGAGFGGRI